MLITQSLGLAHSVAVWPWSGPQALSSTWLRYPQQPPCCWMLPLPKPFFLLCCCCCWFSANSKHGTYLTHPGKNSSTSAATFSYIYRRLAFVYSSSHDATTFMLFRRAQIPCLTPTRLWSVYVSYSHPPLWMGFREAEDASMHSQAIVLSQPFRSRINTPIFTKGHGEPKGWGNFDQVSHLVNAVAGICTISSNLQPKAFIQGVIKDTIINPLYEVQLEKKTLSPNECF